MREDQIVSVIFRACVLILGTIVACIHIGALGFALGCFTAVIAW
jgi:hypothetical protein